jgi:hypothetical protein
MTNSVLRPIAEGFRGSVNLWKGIILALLSVVSVVTAFVNVSRTSDFNNIARRSD